MKYNIILLERIEYILKSAETALRLGSRNDQDVLKADKSKMQNFIGSGLSFILNLYGENHPYYLQFKYVVGNHYEQDVNGAKEIILSIKAEIENGWLSTIKGIISAEIFSDFLEMAEHLLESDYKDASAVMIGSVLEEHLRQLCNKNNIDITVEKRNKIVPLKADTLNNDLAKKDIYNMLEQKSVTAMLDLRNKAAHGKYSEYDATQVKSMYDTVLNFILRNPI